MLRATRRASAALLLLVAALAPPTVRGSAASSYVELVGAMHNHSGYSDGWPDKTPADYYASGHAYGLDFLAGSEHSDNADVPVTFSEGCVGELLPSCIGTTPDHLRKWDATLEQARAASVPGEFTGIRGFEWTSDRFGHINVYFSKAHTNAKIDGGYATMQTFYEWFTRSPTLGGGADGLATFNHPGTKKLMDEPAVNWNDFAPPENFAAVDARMVGIELYNDDQEFGEEYYSHVLDKGWHVGAVGAEDLHGDPSDDPEARRDDYGAPRWAKTVILAKDNSEASIYEAMLARRFYAIRRNDVRLSFTVDDEPMGSRLSRTAGSPVLVRASVDRPGAEIQIVTSGGRVVASSVNGAVTRAVIARTSDRYYFMRVRAGDEWIAYSSPVWVSAVPGFQTGTWLAGDLHVHTCHSHDAYCGPSDDNTGPDEFYTLSGDVSERFLEASLRGLDYLAITDHNDVRSQSDPGFGSHGVIGVPGYENSLDGHAQMLGATSILPSTDVAQMAADFRSGGGVFQANHPADGLTEELETDCSNADKLNWGYGFDIPVDSVEVWNISWHLQPPLPAMTSNEDAATYWECWLQRGARVAATGGSDSHWLSTSAVQGVGNPTTWVFSRTRDGSGVIAAIKEGRTSVSLVPPVLGGPRLLLEADADRNGSYESMIGDEVPPGTPMLVRAEGLLTAGFVEVRANGRDVFGLKMVLPGQSVKFTAPSGTGWVRAMLRGQDLRDQRRTICDSLLGSQTTYCRNRIVMLALTSPIYIR